MQNLQLAYVKMASKNYLLWSKVLKYLLPKFPSLQTRKLLVSKNIFSAIHACRCSKAFVDRCKIYSLKLVWKKHLEPFSVLFKLCSLQLCLLCFALFFILFSLGFGNTLGCYYLVNSLDIKELTSRTGSQGEHEFGSSLFCIIIILLKKWRHNSCFHGTRVGVSWQDSNTLKSDSAL